jgi:hypothetical protein
MTLGAWLVTCILIVTVIPQPAAAQEESAAPQLRYIEEIKQRNADYGPGCDGIGVTVPPTVEMPAEITSNWVASHSACVPGLRLVMTCLGDIVGEERIIGCTLQVADGQAEAALSCDRFTLLLPEDRLTPDETLSEILGQGSDGTAQPCSEAGSFDSGATVALAFQAPGSEPAPDAAILIDLDGSEVPAFFVPASQLDRVTPPDS